MVAQLICGECGEGSVHGVHFRKPITLFADVLDGSYTLHCQIEFLVLISLNLWNFFHLDLQIGILLSLSISKTLYRISCLYLSLC